MVKKTTTSTEEDNSEAIKVMGMLREFEKDCPAQKGRKETWAPYMKSSGAISHYCTYSSSDQGCKKCLYDGNYRSAKDWRQGTD
ncbi:hypothetical protein HN832_02215 [archaeon]|jgi:hypothetical protein|nr:hypothetical protein [archaeon]MBT4373169.1 hypothetical protein [archaeon]MBT4531514.1 hypothetical protein [archaeon]MBT7001308.1 hypothetical protein [archaeon]MBT7282206.1 hypothetical protein [archaeon]